MPPGPRHSKTRLKAETFETETTTLNIVDDDYDNAVDQGDLELGLESHGKQQRSWKVMEKSHIMS